MTRHIEVWYDETSDCDEPVYCVSLCDGDGDELMCLSTHEDESDAIDAGEAAAEKRGIGCVFRSADGRIG